MDLDWATTLLDATLGSRMQARRGELTDVLEGDGLVALLEGRPVGMVTWAIGGSEAAQVAAGAAGAAGIAELRALAVAADARGRGIGRALLDAAEATLRAAGVRDVWLVTTNDNLGALALYQKAGYRLVALRAGAIDELRRTIKPSIGEIGEFGIPIHDELELAREL